MVLVLGCTVGRSGPAVEGGSGFVRPGLILTGVCLSDRPTSCVKRPVLPGQTAWNTWKLQMLNQVQIKLHSCSSVTLPSLYLPAICGIISTVWFPVGAHQSDGLMSFGFSLYAGWVGAALCLLGGSMILCCHGTDPGTPRRENSFYYSRQGGTAMPLDPPANHAKSARVWSRDSQFLILQTEEFLYFLLFTFFLLNDIKINRNRKQRV